MELDKHLNIFRPYKRDPGHEDQLTRAALIVMMLVPLAHESFLGLIDRDRLSTLPPPRFDMQTETLTTASPEADEQDVQEFVSVLLGPHETLKKFSAVEVSERRARYDGVIQYGPRLLVAIESKLITGAGEKQAAEINTKGLTFGTKNLRLVKWHELLDQWWNLTELGVLGPTESAVLNDFFEYTEAHFSDLLPFTDLSRCSSNERRRLRRLCSILEAASGIAAMPSGKRANIKFSNHIVSVDRACLWIDGDTVNFGMWPAELAVQYNRVYGTPSIVSGLAQLSTEHGWDINPNFHLGYRFSHPDQRWYPKKRCISGADYVERWAFDLAEKRAGGRRHDQIDTSFRQWLVERGYAAEYELADLDKWLIDHPNIQIHIRPSVEILKTWSVQEATAMDRQGQFVLAVRTAIDRVLSALEEPPLAPQ